MKKVNKECAGKTEASKKKEPFLILNTNVIICN